MIKKIALRTLIFVAVAFFILSCYIQVKMIFDSSLETQTAELYTARIRTDAECYVLRDEQVIYSDVDGVFNYLVNEGEKLSSKSVIAKVYSSENDLEIHHKVNDINSRIKVLEDSSLEKSYLRVNVSKLDSQIGDYIKLFHNATSNGEYTVVVQNKDDFLTILNKRYLAVNSEEGYKSLIKELEDEKEALNEALSVPVATIYAPISGYFYSGVDGYESIFTPELLEGVSVETFLDTIENADPVKDPRAVGKIVDGFDWYTLCIVDKEDSVFYESGETYRMIYPYSTGLSINCTLQQKVTQTDMDEVILVFKTSNIPEGFNFLRKQKTQIIRDEFEGLKISKGALRIVDGYEGVYVLIGNVVKFKRCDKICDNEGYYIININDPLENESDVKYGYLRMYDSVIVSGKDLYDGKMIG